MFHDSLFLVLKKPLRFTLSVRPSVRLYVCIYIHFCFVSSGSVTVSSCENGADRPSILKLPGRTGNTRQSNWPGMDGADNTRQSNWPGTGCPEKSRQSTWLEEQERSRYKGII